MNLEDINIKRTRCLIEISSKSENTHLTYDSQLIQIHILILKLYIKISLIVL